MEASISMGSNLSFLGVVLVLELNLFFSCFVPCPCSSGRGSLLVFLLGGVCSGPTTEVTSEVRAPELFLSGFACLSWLVTTLVFGSLESFSVTASMMVFISWISTHFVYKLGNHLRFCGCARFTHDSFVFWLLGYFFLFVNLFFFLSYLTISRTSAMVSLAVSTFVVFLAIIMYVILSASSTYWWLCILVLVVLKPLTLVAS